MSFIWTWGNRPTDTFDGVSDVFIRAGVNGDTNYSTNAQLQLKYAGINDDFTRQYLVKVDLTEIQQYNLTVEDCGWNQYLTSDEGFSNNQLQLFRCARDWTFSTVTWNDYDGVNPWSGTLFDHEKVDQGTPDWIYATGSVAGGNKWFEWTSATLISVVQDVLDGVIEAPAGVLNMVFFAQENKNFIGHSSRYGGDTSLRPYFEIQFAGDAPNLGGATGRVPQSFLNWGVSL